MIVPGLEADELEELRELQEVHALISMPGWKTRLQPLLESGVQAAQEAMLGNLSSDPMTYMRNQIKWQQREYMLRDVLSYIADCEARRTRILEDIERRRKESAGEPDSISMEAEYAQ